MDIYQRVNAANPQSGGGLGIIGIPFAANLILDGAFYSFYILWPGLAPFLAGVAIITIPLVNLLVVSLWSCPHGSCLEKLFWTIASVAVIQAFSAYVAFPIVGWLLKAPPFFR